MAKQASRFPQKTGKTVEALPTFVESGVGGILSFPSKTIGFVTKNTRDLIVFVPKLIRV